MEDRFNPLTSGAGTATRTQSIPCSSAPSRCFNPLTSGAGTATRATTHGERPCSKFQSPDERGGYCDYERGIADGLIAVLFQSPDERGGYCDKQ